MAGTGRKVSQTRDAAPPLEASFPSRCIVKDIGQKASQRNAKKRRKAQCPQPAREEIGPRAVGGPALRWAAAILAVSRDRPPAAGRDGRVCAEERARLIGVRQDEWESRNA